MVFLTIKEGKCFFGFDFELLNTHPCCFTSHQRRTKTNKQRLIREVSNISATHAGIVYDVTDTDCRSQNDSINCRIFATLLLCSCNSSYYNCNLTKEIRGHILFHLIASTVFHVDYEDKVPLSVSSFHCHLHTVAF